MSYSGVFFKRTFYYGKNVMHKREYISNPQVPNNLSNYKHMASLFHLYSHTPPTPEPGLL